MIVIFNILLFLKILSFGDRCGFETSYIAKQRGMFGKEWPCQCLGIVNHESTNYSEQYYCFGFNFSYNKLLNYEEGQHPIYQ